MLIKWLIAIIIFIIFFIILGFKIIFSKEEKENRSFCCGKLDKYNNKCNNCKK